MKTTLRNVLVLSAILLLISCLLRFPSFPDHPDVDRIDEDGDDYDDLDMAVLEEIAALNNLELDDVKVLGSWTGLEPYPRRVWKLKIYNRGISRLPASIGDMQRLTNISMGNNQLDSLPPEIGDLEYLEELLLFLHTNLK